MYTVTCKPLDKELETLKVATPRDLAVACMTAANDPDCTALDNFVDNLMNAAFAAAVVSLLLFVVSTFVKIITT